MNERKLASPCGLYCGACIMYLVSKECHGCGCDCGKCFAAECQKDCRIYNCCVVEKKLEACCYCKEFPCSMLIQFSRSPIWLTHLTVLENLRRRKTIGTEKWLKEQKDIWSSEDHCKMWIWFQKECISRNRKFQEEKAGIFSEKK